MPALFHWSPVSCRGNINHRGLSPTCPTADQTGGSFKAVCLGTSPSHAWSLSGAVVGVDGSEWDLWQVTLSDGDQVHPLPFFGHRLQEIRVANRIPKSQVWHVATRQVRGRRRVTA